MFTGLVHEIGVLASVARRGEITRLTLRAPRSAGVLALGDSLAVNGVCLTVTRLQAALVTVEAVAETRRVTTLGQWRSGRRLHLEPALRAGDRLGGHLVLGHVDGVGKVLTRRRSGESLNLEIESPASIRPWLLPKGSISVDGVSLTLNEGPFAHGFGLNLIPHTLAVSLCGEWTIGQDVNLEADVLAKGATARNEAGDETAPPEPDKSLTIERILSRGFGRTRRGH